MAILINKDVRLNEDLITTQLYGRISYKMRTDGKEIEVKLQYFTSKNSYLSSNKHKVRVKGLLNAFLIPYNRAENGVDILAYIHTYIRDFLSSDYYEEGIILKGDDNKDTELGGNFSIEKFCDYDEIEFVDIEDITGDCIEDII